MWRRFYPIQIPWAIVKQTQYIRTNNTWAEEDTGNAEVYLCNFSFSQVFIVKMFLFYDSAGFIELNYLLTLSYIYIYTYLFSRYFFPSNLHMRMHLMFRCFFVCKKHSPDFGLRKM